MYLTYDEYLEQGGSCEDESVFDRNEFKARKCLDIHTMNRITDHVTTITESIRRCMFELIQTYETESEIGNDGISSVSNDGVSVNYSSTFAADQNAKRSCIIAQYLAGETDDDGFCLLYRGEP